jgi:hypothetical protein
LTRFSPRFILGACIILLVLVIVAAGRLLGHASPSKHTLPADQPQIVSAGAAHAIPSDSVAPDASASPMLHKPEPPAQPAGAATPASVATSFATAWLRHDNVTSRAWLDGLTPYATDDLLAQLNGVDPATVPANRLTRTVTIDNDTATDCVAHATTDSGVLSLSLELISGGWLVSSIDWAAS